nr:hypothetical protein [Angustibacter aerolatus]
MARSLVVKVTAGADAPERCSQAFTVASTALAAGVAVSLWLTGESAWFALPGRAASFEPPHSAPLPEPARRAARRRPGHPVHPVRGPPRHRAGRRAGGRADRRRRRVRRGGAARGGAGARVLSRAGARVLSRAQRCLRRSHHSRLPRYHSIASARPASNSTCGA